MEHGTCGNINNGCAVVMSHAGIESTLYYQAEGFPFTHIDGGFKVKDRYYHFDLRADLFRIQTGMRTHHFAISQEKLYNMFYHENSVNDRTSFLLKMNVKNNGKDFTEIPESTLQLWDNEFGFNYHGLYTDNIFEMLKNETMDQQYCKQFFRYIQSR